MESTTVERPLSHLEKAQSRFVFLSAFCLLAACLGLPAKAASAPTKSQIIVQNDTGLQLLVQSITTSGDSLNKKAWKQGDAEIPAATRKTILTLNRSGKVNWMDPTPRFVEPGKTVVFAIKIALADAVDNDTITLKQKLLGTGKSSKMWHSIEVAGQDFAWTLEDTEVTGSWTPTDSAKLKFNYQSLTEKGNTHVLYRFSLADE